MSKDRVTTWRDPTLVDWGASSGAVLIRMWSDDIVSGTLDLEEINVNEPPLATFVQLDGTRIDPDEIAGWRYPD